MNQLTIPTSPGSDPVLEVRELIETCGQILDSRLEEVTVTGTISGYKQGRYRAYGQLISHDANNQPTARLPVVINRQAGKPGMDLNGSQIEATGHLTTHPLYGPIQLTATAIRIVEPESAATRAVERLRHAILAEELHLANKQHRLRYDARRVVVICPTDRGAGGTDLIERLTTGPHTWELTTIETVMGGPTATTNITTAITTHTARRDIDAVIVCRGGGPPSDLAPFDSPDVARAIVQAALPVIVAVGHSTDHHLADLVAHTSLPTPSASAAWLNQQRDTAATQARTLAVKATEATALAQQTRASEAATRAVLAEATANRRERHALYAFLTALLLTVTAIAMAIMVVVY